MIERLTSNTQAILLLTAPLIAGHGETTRDLLSLGEYNRLARILREKRKQIKREMQVARTTRADLRRTINRQRANHRVAR